MTATEPAPDTPAHDAQLATDDFYVPSSRPGPDLDELTQYIGGSFASGSDAEAAAQKALDDAGGYELSRLSGPLMVADGADPPTTIPGPVARAILMRAAALWRRRNSVNGFDGYDDLGTVPVRGSDPDMERLVDRWRSWSYA